MKVKAFSVLAFFMRFLNLAAVTSMPIVLRALGVGYFGIGESVSLIWLGSGIGTLLSMIRPVGLRAASATGFALSSICFLLVLFFQPIAFMPVLGFALSLVELPALEVAGEGGETGLWVYYSSLSVGTLLSSAVMPFLMLEGARMTLVALSSISAVSATLSVAAGKKNVSRSRLSVAQLLAFSRRFLPLFVLGLAVYLQLSFVYSFEGPLLLDNGFPDWLAQACFFVLFLSSAIVRLAKPTRLLSLDLLATLSLASFLIITQWSWAGLSVLLLSDAGMGAANGLLSVAFAQKVLESSSRDFPNLNVLVGSSSGISSFLGPLLGGWMIGLAGWEVASAAYGAVSGTLVLIWAFWGRQVERELAPRNAVNLRGRE